MANSVFDLIKHGAQRFGIAVSRYPPPGTLERHLGEYLSAMGINLVLDVGAYVGDYARELRTVGYRGRIISFEPVPASFQRLSESMRGDALWAGQPYGLSNADREAVINTHERGDFNSLLELRDDAGKVYRLDPAARSQTAIQLRRLDSVLPQLLEGVGEPRIFLKMDTQGHDMSVLEGAAGVIGMVLGLQSELAVVELYDGMSSMASSLAYCASCGFLPVGFYPVNTLHKAGVTPEFDVLFNRFQGILSELPAAESAN